MTKELDKAYDPKKYEDNIYKEWEKAGLFNPDNQELPAGAPAYSIVMPPPNVTGTLHMGHAAMLALEDILVRFRRMCGQRTLWVPGTDHAAIATQTKVEKIIKEEGTDRHKLGRDGFLKRVEAFASDSHDTIVNQVKKMGSSCDWSREAYTLDATRTKAVRSVFKMMYDDGLVYRGERIVNWCPRCHSTLADDEVEYKKQGAKLYYFKYDHKFPFTIATTRPETKLGDTAVAVNPEDSRFKEFVGRTFEADFAGVPLTLKIIADRNVDLEFGTGALGVTPAHAVVDWQMAEANKLPIIKVIDEDGRIHAGFGEYSGRTVEEARALIVNKLEAAGLIEKIEEIENNLSLCYRCGTAIEPLPSLQWFIDVNKKITRNTQHATHSTIEWSGKSIKDVALEVVKSGKIRIVPERFEKNYYNWMENLRDWCISRQIWFGHQVPVWYGPSIKYKVESRKFIDLNFRDEVMFEAIKNGTKTVETRALNPEEPDRYFGDLKAGDLIVLNRIENGRIVESLKTTVAAANIFKDTEGLFNIYNVERIIPGSTARDVELFYDSIPGYRDKIVKNGLVAIELGGSEKADGGKIYLAIVRHGQTDWNKNGLMQGQTDVPLNDKGKGDARKLGKKIEHEQFDIVITSPLKRTSETAALLNTFGVEMIEDERLKERSYGKFEGQKTSEILKDHPEIKTFEVNGLPYWIEVPTAESYDQVRARVEDFLRDLRKKYAGKRVLVVSHGDTLDMFYAVLNGLPNEKAYGRFSLNMRLEKYELDAGREELYVGLEAPAGDGWRQDEDTLDTWFSSGLWTFSTLAHSPDQIRLEGGKLIIDSDDFRNFHPTAVLETGYDILFFWVARMIIMTTYAIGDIPFRDVYLHGLVLDEQGKKMSKSKGNTIDPLIMCDCYGTDATRLSLVLGTSPGNDLRLSEDKIAGYRNLVNKLWNVSRFVMQNAKCKMTMQNARCKMQNDNAKYKITGDSLTAADKWILAKMRELITLITEDIEQYRFAQAGERLRTFTWDDLADWYLEASKFETEGQKDAILPMVLRDLLKLWHPFTPFVTEAIWGEGGWQGSLMTERWPEPQEYEQAAGSDGEAFELVKAVVTAIRNARSENKVEPARKIKAVVYAGEQTEALRTQAGLIKGMRTGVDEIVIEASGGKEPDAIYASASGIEIYLTGAVDAAKEKARLAKEIAKFEQLVAGIEGKLANKEFAEKAPPAVVEKEREKLAAWQSELEKLKEQSRSSGY